MTINSKDPDSPGPKGRRTFLVATGSLTSEIGTESAVRNMRKGAKCSRKKGPLHPIRLPCDLRSGITGQTLLLFGIRYGVGVFGCIGDFCRDRFFGSGLDDFRRWGGHQIRQAGPLYRSNHTADDAREDQAHAD